ncbi:MAG: ribonuclease P protein component [Oscillospiraceae bacterium]|jgi:ribonuclease P protein component
MNSERRTLNRNYEFRKVYRNGKSFVSPLLVTHVLRRKSGGIYTGISASRKIGCAVRRNRARRIVRAAAAEVLRDAAGSYDIVFTCRTATAASKTPDVARTMREHLKKAGITD